MGGDRSDKVVLRAFTSKPRLAEILPPIPLADCLPEWWKQAEAYTENPQKPKVLSRLPTIKHCYAVQELFRRAIGFRLWQDVNLAIETDGQIVSEGPNPKVKPGGYHAVTQFPNAFGATVQHYKFYSPWSFVCEQMVHFAWTHPFYHQRDPFRFQTMDGLVEYRHQHTTNINILIPRPTQDRVELSFTAGEMMAYLIPMTDLPVQVLAEEVDREEFDRINFAMTVTQRQLLFNRRHRVKPYTPRRPR